MKIRIVFSGRGYDRAERLPGELELPDRATLREALAELQRLLGDGVALPPSCLVAVSGQHAGTVEQHDNRSLQEGDELMLIAPVAGG